MLPAERLEKILDILRSKKAVKVEDLAKTFDVSVMTIRRDIDKLSQEGLVKRSYGGIVQNSRFAKDMGYREKEILNLSEKQAIARFCFDHLLPDSGVIYLDTGSTVLELAKLLRDNLSNDQCKALTIITNDIVITNQLLSRCFNLIVIGGTVQNPLGCIHGYTAMNQLKDLRIDTSFTGGLCVDGDFDLFASGESKSFFRRRLIDNSNQSYLLIDSSKLYRQSLFRTHSLSVYNAIISDRNLTTDEDELAQKKGVTWINSKSNS